MILSILLYLVMDNYTWCTLKESTHRHALMPPSARHRHPLVEDGLYLNSSQIYDNCIRRSSIICHISMPPLKPIAFVLLTNKPDRLHIEQWESQLELFDKIAQMLAFSEVGTLDVAVLLQIHFTQLELFCWTEFCFWVMVNPMSTN